MLLDHSAAAFLPAGSWAWFLLRFIGRLADPVMAWFIAEGYVHTRSVGRYVLRLGIFALLSWVPACLFEYGVWPYPYFGVIWSLLLGLLAIWLWDRSAWPTGAKAGAVLLLCLLSFLGDWPVMNVIWPLCFFLTRGNSQKQRRCFLLTAAAFCICSLLSGGPEQLFQLGLFAAPALMSLYNGEGGPRTAFRKWFFFVFYPVHLLVLWALR